jgi:hypothetical protein
MQIIKLISYLFILFSFSCCNPEIKLESKFGLKYFSIGGGYYYIENADKLVNDPIYRIKLLQFAYCKFNSNNELYTIEITSKYFESWEEINFFPKEGKKVVASIRFVVENGNKIPYFPYQPGINHLWQLNKASQELLDTTFCAVRCNLFKSEPS